MTLRAIALFPHSMLPVQIINPRYRSLLGDSLKSHRMFCVAMQNTARTRESPYRVAGLGLIRSAIKHENGSANLILQGLIRVRLERVKQYRPYRIYSIQPMQTTGRDGEQVPELASEVRYVISHFFIDNIDPDKVLLKKILGLSKASNLSKLGEVSINQVVQYLCGLEDPEQLADLASSTLLSCSQARQTVLETTSLENRLRYLLHFLKEQQSSEEDEDDLEEEEEDEEEEEEGDDAVF